MPFWEAIRIRRRRREMIWFFRGLLIAFIFGIPAGAIGALTVQRTLKNGFLTGLLTGLGSTAADMLYACAGAFGITLISTFLQDNQRVIGILCGMGIIGFGMYIIIHKEPEKTDTRSFVSTGWKAFLTSFTLAIVNPATVVTFLTAFAGLGISRVPDSFSGISLVVGIGVGTTLWWVALAGGTAWLKTKMSMLWLDRAAKGMGMLMIGFGLWSIIRVL